MVDLVSLGAVVAGQEVRTGCGEVGRVRFRLEEHSGGHVEPPGTHGTAEHPVLDSCMPEMGCHRQSVWACSDYDDVSTRHRRAPSGSSRIRRLQRPLGSASYDHPTGDAHLPGKGDEGGAQVGPVEVVVALPVEKVLGEGRQCPPGRQAVRSLTPALDVLLKPFDVALEVPHLDSGSVAGHREEGFVCRPSPQELWKGDT